jgi:geranylgeranyl diphosphate synthase type II
LNFIKLIEKNLNKFLPSPKIPPKILHKAMRYSVFSPGKRIRPIISIEAAVACAAIAKKAIGAACAIEFVHTYSLIHDDLPSMDDDDYRRGRLSCHKKFGQANAILAGDALLTLAFNVLANEYSPEVSSEMIRELSSAIGSLGMVGGQALDIAGDKNLKNVNFLKTAKLFETSAVLGALSANAGKKQIEAMRKYGLNLGMAFQAVDDILDGENKCSRADAEFFIAKARAALKPFGAKALGLLNITDKVMGLI